MKEIKYFNKWINMEEVKKGIDYNNYQIVNTDRESHIIVKDNISLHEVVSLKYAKDLVDKLNMIVLPCMDGVNENGKERA